MSPKPNNQEVRMKNKAFLIHALFLAVTSFVMSGCGTKVGTGSVNVAFSNNTGALLRNDFAALGVRGVLSDLDLQSSSYLGVTPDIYRMKLVAMYLVEDIDGNQDNVGALTRIWTSSKCDADLTLCGIGPAAGEYIVDYFDFAAGTAAVNQTLASYQRDTKESTVNPGTYRYIRLDFQGATGSQIDTTTANLEFGTSSAQAVRAQVGALTVQLSEPLVIAEGNTFTINLAYDLENRFYASGDPGNPPAEVASDDKWTCNGTSAGVPCIVEAPFSPTVVQN